jgi:hypothetical protein
MQLIQITVITLPHIMICYILFHLFPSHYRLRFDILFFSFLLPAAIVMFITTQQRTAHDANSTYLTVLLFSHILNNAHSCALSSNSIRTVGLIVIKFIMDICAENCWTVTNFIMTGAIEAVFYTRYWIDFSKLKEKKSLFLTMLVPVCWPAPPPLFTLSSFYC